MHCASLLISNTCTYKLIIYACIWMYYCIPARFSATCADRSGRLYMYVFWLYMPVYVCMIEYISIYKQIQTVMFLHMLCYICIYILYIYVYIRSYMHNFAAKSLSRTIWARMSTYIHIWTTICTYICMNTYILQARYMQNTCMFFVHAARYM